MNLDPLIIFLLTILGAIAVIPAYNTAHKYLTIREGKVRIAQRFAIDFYKVDAEGNILPSPFPDEITNKMFYGWSSTIIGHALRVAKAPSTGTWNMDFGVKLRPS